MALFLTNGSKEFGVGAVDVRVSVATGGGVGAKSFSVRNIADNEISDVVDIVVSVVVVSAVVVGGAEINELEMCNVCAQFVSLELVNDLKSFINDFDDSVVGGNDEIVRTGGGAY